MNKIQFQLMESEFILIEEEVFGFNVPKIFSVNIGQKYLFKVKP